MVRVAHPQKSLQLQVVHDHMSVKVAQPRLHNLRVPDQNGISQLYNMLEIYHSGLEPSILFCMFTEYDENNGMSDLCISQKG